MADPLETIQDELAAVLPRVDRERLAAFTDRLADAGRVFVAGEGRSGLMARAFAMRLMHLGSTVFVVGETITPAVEPGDTLVAVSGSGATAGTVRVAEQARDTGATVLAVTTDPGSPLARAADTVLEVPAATKHRRAGEASTNQPLSSLFDQATHLVLDAVTLDLATRRGTDNAAARAAHSNVE
ncbi:MAG TPA: 6-phospho-3-hexuloisomerase [Actinophytocola sp.]|nr:6-phospho-3-hexuloisomerase [Actinophytocola sp.]